MPKKKLTPTERNLCVTALQLLPLTGWEGLSRQALAQAAHIPSRAIPEKNALLRAIVAMIDEDVARNLPPFTTASCLQDKLFDVFMTRFEQLQPHRAGIIIISEVCKQSPELAFAHFKLQADSMRSMLNLVKYPQRKTLFPYVLLGIYQLSFSHWVSDSTNDLSPTMVYLNECLAMIMINTDIV